MGHNSSPAAAPGIGSREPVTVASAIMIAVQSVMAAIWSALADTGNLGGLTPGTQALITGALMALVTVIVMTWTARKTTAKAAPSLPAGTRITVTNDAEPSHEVTLSHTKDGRSG